MIIPGVTNRCSPIEKDQHYHESTGSSDRYHGNDDAHGFLDFRDMLRPASGFQSWQFKEMEARLGLKYENRVGHEYYISQLKPDEVAIIKEAEKQTSLLALVNDWLERMPFFDDPLIWKNFTSVHHKEGMPFYWANYRECYRESLVSAEESNLAFFDHVFFQEAGDHPRSLSARASRAAYSLCYIAGTRFCTCLFNSSMNCWRSTNS